MLTLSFSFFCPDGQKLLIMTGQLRFGLVPMSGGLPILQQQYDSLSRGSAFVTTLVQHLLVQSTKFSGASQDKIWTVTKWSNVSSTLHQIGSTGDDRLFSHTDSVRSASFVLMVQKLLQPQRHNS